LISASVRVKTFSRSALTVHTDLRTRADGWRRVVHIPGCRSCLGALASHSFHPRRPRDLRNVRSRSFALAFSGSKMKRWPLSENATCQDLALRILLSGLSSLPEVLKASSDRGGTLPQSGKSLHFRTVNPLLCKQLDWRADC